MSRKTVVRLLDDLDGGEAVETVGFCLDGQAYEIDLSAKNAAALRRAMSRYIEHARKLPRRARKVSQ